MTPRSEIFALMRELPAPENGEAPDWVHLLPAPVDGYIQTNDKRGPYRVVSLQAIADASLANGAIPFDENHASHMKDVSSAPARGWIEQMQVRADGLWGRVEWTEEGRKLVTGRAYRSVSPALVLASDKETVVRLQDASLVNHPGLKGLTRLKQETEMDLSARLAKALGLEEGADDDAIVAAVMKYKKGDGEEAALQSRMSDIGVALGCDASAEHSVILAAAKAAKPEDEVTQLMKQVTDLSTEIETMKADTANKAAEAEVDAAIAAGKVGVKPARDTYVSLMKSDPDQTRKAIAALPTLSGQLTGGSVPQKDGTTVALNSEEVAVAAQLGLSHEDFIAARDGKTEKEVS